MTAPIQEPSAYRTLSGHSWGISQLARRPMPVSAEGVYPYVFRKHDSGQTIGPGNVEYIVWDSSDFDEAGGYFTAGDATSFNITQQGVYDFLGAVVWNAPFNSKTMLQVQCDAFGNYPSALGWGGFYDDSNTLLDQDQAFFIHFQARVASGTSATALAVSQANASGQDLFEAFFRVAWIADWTGDGVGAEGDFVFL